MTRVVAVVGNPRAGSRTHRVASALAEALAGSGETEVIELASFGGRVLDFGDTEVAAAVERVLAADVLVVASPTYKASYTGLLKCFLDRIGGGALDGTPVVGLMLGAAPDHRLAVDSQLTPVLLELGASIPARGLFVLDADVDAAIEQVRDWAAANAARVIPR